ncbi:hypothetical protein ACMFMG_009554 [Clarireedia jacksonii]
MHSQKLTYTIAERFSSMMFLITKLFLLSLVSSSTAYWIKFHSGSKCTGDSLLRSHISSTNQACQTRSASKAISAFVTNTGSSDDNAVVVFYASKNCDPKTAIARVEDGCTRVKSLDVSYGSFNVIHAHEKGRDTPVSKNGEAFSDGGMGTYKSKEYKWQKTINGEAKGVIAREWNDAIVTLKMDMEEAAKKAP